MLVENTCDLATCAKETASVTNNAQEEASQRSTADLQSRAIGNPKGLPLLLREEQRGNSRSTSIFSIVFRFGASAWRASDEKRDGRWSYYISQYLNRVSDRNFRYRHTSPPLPPKLKDFPGSVTLRLKHELRSQPPALSGSYE